MMEEENKYHAGEYGYQKARKVSLEEGKEKGRRGPKEKREGRRKE
jgi:hypothetical protein